MSYDFTTLSPEDFENLTVDILSRDWNTRVESFKPGKDAGIDLRNTRVLQGDEKTTIVQCKRYAPHKFGQLMRSVEAEADKLPRLRPDRYVLVTSVPLSPANKETLKTAFAPWCRATGDIYGATEVNDLLRRYPEIERAHFKLWVSSTAVLERILHARIFNFTEATLEATRAQLSRIVIHSGFDRALQVLRDEHHVLIVGNPGIGKTTLARLLMCHYVQEGFEPICVVKNIEEAWELVQGSVAANRKIVILYDDFLGRFRFDVQRFGKNEEHSLFEFLDKVRRSPNLRFILTTREYIMADARRVHGAFNDRAGEIFKCTLTLEDYSKHHRAKMLFNHLYFSDLPDARLKALVTSKAYATLVNHAKFNPRIVESISTYANSRSLTDEQYLAFIQQEFDNPAKIWEHPFWNDISPVARTTLAALWTFGGTADLETLKASVSKLSLNESRADLSFLFNEALRQLDGNSIMTNRYPERSEKEEPVLVARFHNPSVEEFVDNILAADRNWVEQLVSGILTFRQVQNLLSHTSEAGSRLSFSASFWKTLRHAALTVIPDGGRVINYRRYGGETEEIWDTDTLFTKPRRTLTQLLIEAQVRQRDAIFEAIQAQVLTVEGWTALLQEFPSDESVAWSARDLHKWITGESGWTAAEKKTSHEAFRRAVVGIIADDDQVWPANVGSLKILAQIIQANGHKLREEERHAFASAAKTVAQTIRDNADDAEDVIDEADELDELGRTCDVKVEAAVSSLRSHAVYLAEKQAERETSDHESTAYASQDTQRPLDLDFLFGGLLDR